MNFPRPIPANRQDEIEIHRPWARLPNWPRLLPELLAAAYVGGVSIGTFRTEVEQGIWPPPIRRGRRIFWDLGDLDRAVDRLKGIVSDTLPDQPSGLGDINWDKSA